MNLASGHFPCLNSAHVRLPKLVINCRTISEIKAPEAGGVGRMGGHMATSQRKFGAPLQNGMSALHMYNCVGVNRLPKLKPRTLFTKV
jgi:hypothetical protein